VRTGSSPVGGAAGCSAHALGSRLTRRRFSRRSLSPKKISSPAKLGFEGCVSREETFFS
jgi:hypothetical protein